eukprot:1556284-Rhodomonas_salina.1
MLAGTAGTIVKVRGKRARCGETFEVELVRRGQVEDEWVEEWGQEGKAAALELHGEAEEMWRNIEELKEKLKAEKEKVKAEAGKWKEEKARLQTELAQAMEQVEKAAREREAREARVRAKEKAVALPLAAQSEAPASSGKPKSGKSGLGFGTLLRMSGIKSKSAKAS